MWQKTIGQYCLSLYPLQRELQAMQPALRGVQPMLQAAQPELQCLQKRVMSILSAYKQKKCRNTKQFRLRHIIEFGISLSHPFR